ncbi:MAG: hypothetical protein J5993_05480 [Clostridia bacterium]|nr:hypothetical protein [Clostridia bacterium]
MAKLKQLYFWLLFAFCAVFFFTNDFGIVEIQKTAIVLGVGIDRNGEGFSITAQLAVPQKSEQKNSTDSVEVSGVGQTVGEALTAINSTTGWHPTLSFCNLVVLGESAVEGEIYAGLEYFFRNENVPDYALVATCEGSAKEFLSSKTPTADMSTFAVEKILSSEAKRSGVVLPLSLREFSIDYFTERGGYLPIIVKKEQEKGQGSKQTNEQGAQETEYLFDATKTALFSRGQKKGELSPMQTLTLGIMKNNVRIAAFPVTQNGIGYTLGVRRAKTSFSVEQGKRIKVKISLSASAIMLDSDASHTVDDISKTELVEAPVLTEAERAITEQISALIDETRRTDCDFFGIKNLVHKKFPRTDTGEGFLNEIDFSVSVKLKNP